MWGEIRVGTLGEPSNQADHTLVLFLPLDEGGAVIGFIRFGARVYWQAGTVGGSVRSDVLVVDVVVFDKVCRKS